MIPQTQIQQAVAAATALRAQGYFARVQQGDVTAASYFARLVAYTVNPQGDPNGFGCLGKTPGETNVEGFADGAIVYGANEFDLENVLKIVTQVGSTNAGIGSAVQPRRPENHWVAPQPLSVDRMRYLNPSYDPAPTPTPTPQPPSNELATIKAQLEALTGVVGSLVVAITDLHNDNADLKSRVVDVRVALRNGLAIDAQGKIPFAGSVSLKGSAKG